MVNLRPSQVRSERVSPIGWISPVTWGLANAGITLVLMCGIIAIVASLADIGERTTAILLEIANVGAALVGGVTAGRRAGRHGLPNGVVVGLGYAILFMFITGSGIPAMGLASVGLRRALVAIISGAVGGIIGVNFANFS